MFFEFSLQGGACRCPWATCLCTCVFSEPLFKEKMWSNRADEVGWDLGPQVAMAKSPACLQGGLDMQRVDLGEQESLGQPG